MQLKWTMCSCVELVAASARKDPIVIVSLGPLGRSVSIVLCVWNDNAMTVIGG